MMKLKVTLFGVLTAVSLGIVAPYASGQDGGEAYTAYLNGDYATALKEWRPLAEQGNLFAQYDLGQMYRYGVGVPQNYKEAARWYRLAAEQGHFYAQFDLGWMYSDGKGVLQDDEEAARWYRLAAEQGHAPAQNNLGAMYWTGVGAPKDYIYSHMWFNLAAANGHDGAESLRDIVAKIMTPTQIEQAQTLAKECLRKNYKGC